MDHPTGRPLFGCLIIALLVIACIGSISIVLDQACQSTLNQRLPLYPGAEIVTERYSFFSRFGVGETYLELYSPDDPDTVQRWYGRTTGQITRQAALTNDPIYRLAVSRFRVRRDANGTGGSEITLLGQCVIGGG